MIYKWPDVEPPCEFCPSKRRRCADWIGVFRPVTKEIERGRTNLSIELKNGAYRFGAACKKHYSKLEEKLNAWLAYFMSDKPKSLKECRTDEEIQAYIIARDGLAEEDYEGLEFKQAGPNAIVARLSKD